MDKLTVVDGNGARVGEIEVSWALAEERANPQLLHDVMVSYLRNRRGGSASTLTRGEVKASGRKPWRQKGTGRARAGSVASPLWRGGGVIFGPKPRDLVRPIPRRLRHKAFRAVLADKLREGKVVVVETTQTAGVKTRDVVHWLARIGAKDRPLIVLGGRNDEVARASRNIKGATAVPRTELNALTLMMHGAVVISRDDFRAMQEQLT